MADHIPTFMQSGWNTGCSIGCPFRDKYRERHPTPPLPPNEKNAVSYYPASWNKPDHGSQSDWHGRGAMLPAERCSRSMRGYPQGGRFFQGFIDIRVRNDPLGDDLFLMCFRIFPSSLWSSFPTRCPKGISGSKVQASGNLREYTQPGHRRPMILPKTGVGRELRCDP